MQNNITNIFTRNPFYAMDIADQRELVSFDGDNDGDKPTKTLNRMQLAKAQPTHTVVRAPGRIVVYAELLEDSDLMSNMIHFGHHTFEMAQTLANDLGKIYNLPVVHK